ncbi:MAG TPA: WbqC family protein [Acidimicrobiales bacterium]|nr:WbqC family protein [Acidimicrobiales bacterium]
MIVTGHQLNTLPGVSVMRKVAMADAVIWMDQMQYRRHSWVNRNRFSDGTMFTIPVAEHDTFAPINEVRIADPTRRFREKAARTLENKLGLEIAAPYAREIRRPYRLLAGLNARLLHQLCADLGIQAEQHYQSHLGAGRYDDTSEGLAEMVAELGGTVWLSGPSGRNYLDEEPFHERGITVRFFDYEGESNPTAVELLKRPAVRAA